MDATSYATALYSRLRPYNGPWNAWTQTLGGMQHHPRQRLQSALLTLRRAGLVQCDIVTSDEGRVFVTVYRVHSQGAA